MPWKSFNKCIYQVYMAKAAEIQADKLGKTVAGKTGQPRSISPIEEEKGGNIYLKNIKQKIVDDSNINKYAQSGEHSPK